MRFRPAAAAVALLALLAAGASPAASPCPLPGAIPHGCCSGQPPAPVADGARCCSAGEPSDLASSADDGHGSRCDCIHAPAAPAAEAVAGPTPPSDELHPAGEGAAARRAALTGGASVRPAEHKPSSIPPPIFLLDCAFLI